MCLRDFLQSKLLFQESVESEPENNIYFIWRMLTVGEGFHNISSNNDNRLPKILEQSINSSRANTVFNKSLYFGIWNHTFIQLLHAIFKTGMKSKVYINL